MNKQEKLALAKLYAQAISRVRNAQTKEDGKSQALKLCGVCDVIVALGLNMDEFLVIVNSLPEDE